MLAAAGWPMSEIWHKELAEAFDLDSLLVNGDKAPSVLNGGKSDFRKAITCTVGVLFNGEWCIRQL